jgi:hypothetical protein
LAKFERLLIEAFKIAPITSLHFRTAARFADQSGTGLRASDALHLAIASEQGASIGTLDEILANAAASVGVAAQLL